MLIDRIMTIKATNAWDLGKGRLIIRLVTDLDRSVQIKWPGDHHC